MGERIRAFLIWMAWGAGVGAAAAVVITTVIVKSSHPPFFSIENYFVAAGLGAGVGIVVAGIGAAIQAWKNG